MRFTGAEVDTYQTFERRWKKLGYENMTREEQVFYLLESLMVAVDEGGLTQYFGGPVANEASAMVDALAELDAVEASEALATAINKAWPGSYPHDAGKRRDMIFANPDKYDELFAEETRVIGEHSKGIESSALAKLSAYYNKAVMDDRIDPKELALGLLGAPIRSRRTAVFGTWIVVIVSLIVVWLLFTLISHYGLH